MRLDQGSLIFTPRNGECPSWETALGQSHEGSGDLPPYHFKAEGYENLLKGMFFNSIPLAEVSCILGKQKFFVTASESYKSSQNQEIQLASRFDTIVVRCENEVKTFRDIPIILLFTKIQDENKFHFGRRSIKYSPHTSVGLSTKNSDSFERIQKHFNTRLTCYGLFVDHFDTLNFYCVDADSNYNKEQWKSLRLPETEWTDWASWEIKEREKYDFQKYLEFPIFDESFVHGLNNEQIIQKMATILRQEWVENGYPGVHYFGFKYSKVLKQIKASPAEIIKWANEHNTDNRIPTTYNGEISKTIKVFECAEKDNDVKVAYHGTADVNENSANHIVDNLNKLENSHQTLPIPNFTPTQIIYYGVPGCGKSHTITTMLKDEKVKDPTFSEENQVVRTTFHPEYTNADFIGQILPEVHEDSQGKSVVEYKFKPGPFAKILKQALHNPSRPFYLVIEEINRGNAAAIFGDVFQLLDRLKNGDTSKEPVGTDGFENHYGKGWSEYFVMNADVNAYIRDVKGDDELDTKSIDVSGIHFSSSTGLRLPPNLSIYATMNTSDQNVFTLDNAFQRRWDMELVPNICKWNDEDHKNQAKSKIGDTDIRWETFRKAINSEISDGDFFNADDKQLGLFFIEAEGEKIDGKKFANKVLKYLWADVFKRDTGKIFKSENLSGVVENFTGTDAFDKVFVEDFAQSLKNANDEIKNHE
ncbi:MULTISPECIES: hypothetical protein [unclassified Fibrobacter]|uniref:hypothetical protein n=1 Tax=unclassified Fibrobacter TaxID=2634177 RepID=UPI0025C3ADB8|nr:MULTISPECIES: hypothetical protein [unclassified Fibrobacter]